MKLLQIKPVVHLFDTFEKFITEFPLDKKTCLFTAKFLYENFMQKYNISCDVIFFEDYGMGEPSDEMIDQIFADVRKKEYETIVAIGGGSIIDVAKLLALKPNGSALDFFEKKVEPIKDKKLILVPTTCGTGSEVTNISISEIKSKHTKMGLAVEPLFADHAVLVTEFVEGLPFSVFASSSIDALIHAMESFLSPRDNCYTELFSGEAIKLIIKAYKTLKEKGKDAKSEVIKDVLIASNYAGIAFGNTGVGAVHALSYPLGGVYHVPHGEANYQFLVEVFKAYQKKDPKGRIQIVNNLLAESMGLTSIDNVYEELTELLEFLLHKKPLREYGMKEEEIEGFADSVLKTQQRLLANNYVELSFEEIRAIYKALW